MMEIIRGGIEPLEDRKLKEVIGKGKFNSLKGVKSYSQQLKEKFKQQRLEKLANRNGK